MSISRKSLIGGIIGVIVAIGLIAAGAFAFGGANGSFFGIGASHTSSNSITTTTAGLGSNGGGSSSGSFGSGTLQLSMIDPPNAPGNVTGVYINYTSIKVHVANAGNQSGWYNVTSSGSIDLMKIVNSSKVLGSAKLPNGTYNIVRFNITSAVVTVQNSSTGADQNFTANVPSGMVQSVITGGVNVRANTTSALLVNITPKVTYGGNNQYTLIPAATAAPSTPVAQQQSQTTTTTHEHHNNLVPACYLKMSYHLDNK